MPLVEIKNLSFRYHGHENYVLKNINLDVHAGEFILIIGPSGGGKSTLVNCINGIIPHVIEGVKKGKVIVDGYDVDETPIKEMAKIVGTVFQNPETQFFSLSVLDEIAFAMENLKFSREEMEERINWVIQELGLEGLLRKEVSRLSGGQKQLVAIASVLALQPKLLIFDEPTTNLDPQGAYEVLNIIEKIKEFYGRAIILIEHKLDKVAPLADRIWVISNGEVIIDDTPQEVFKNPGKIYELGLKPPSIVEISIRLRNEGLIEPSELPLTVDEFMDIIQKYNLRNVSSRDFTFTTDRITINSSDKPLIEVRNLWHQYPDGTVALRGISLDIYKGEFIGIIGPNGSGKSTLVSHFLGLLSPSHGYVKIFGRNVREYSVSQLSKIVGFIFQNPDLMLFQTTVWNELAFGPSNLGLPKKEIERRVKEALAMMRLEGFEERHPHALSRGQRHRVAVASVLTMYPEILIADEPTTGQDYGACRKYLDLLKKMNEAGRTIIIISHDMSLIAEYVERVIIMVDGRILIDGPTRLIFEKEDLLRKVRIEPPPPTQLSLRLKDNGYDVPVCLTVDEVHTVIRSLLAADK